MTLSPLMDATAACGTPEGLALVDAAFARQGSPAQRRLETFYCPECPIAQACLIFALDNGEAGPWGGTNQRRRNKHTPRRPYHYNLRDVEMNAARWR